MLYVNSAKALFTPSATEEAQTCLPAGRDTQRLLLLIKCSVKLGDLFLLSEISSACAKSKLFYLLREEISKHIM
jgi:hypothetical protein